MTETEKIMAEALERISKLAKSWEGRSDAPYWNLGDIATATLIKVANKPVDTETEELNFFRTQFPTAARNWKDASLKGSYVCDCDGENGLHTPDCDVWITPRV